MCCMGLCRVALCLCCAYHCFVQRCLVGDGRDVEHAFLSGHCDSPQHGVCRQRHGHGELTGDRILFLFL